MFKKLLKLATTFTLLLGCYLGYVRAFTVVVAHLTAARKVDDVAFITHDSKNKKEAVRFAREAFGPDHWTAADDLQLRYYNPDRGFWMYSKSYKRPLEEDGVKYDGKRLRLSPAAIIWRARDGSGTKTVTAEEATIDFNRPLGFQAKGDAEPMVVKFARLERNVLIRDDRGTPGDPKDDMVIGPLTWVAFDDSKLQVFSDSDVRIVDRDTTVTGQGLLIQLRPKSQPGPAVPKANGFEGAQSARLLKNVDVFFVDVGKTGILPGSATATRTEPDKVEVQAAVDHARDRRTAGTAPGREQPESLPLHVHCDGAMQVDLPKPATPVKEGPPAPPRPTFVHFTRNVVVRRGKLDEIPDQLDCDNLDLTLLPAEGAAKKPVTAPAIPGEKPAPELAAKTPTEPSAGAGGSSSDEEKGLFGDLTLRRVKATGHAVWLQQPVQGSKVFCNELIHEVAPPGGEDRTYFRVDSSRKHWMLEKFDFAEERPEAAEKPSRRTVQSVTHVWAMDATLLNDTGDMAMASLVARGPGLLETRPGPSKDAPPDREVPADRTATWQDQLFLKNELGPDRKLAQRILTLKGRPRLVDRDKGSSLDAVDRIVIWLKPDPDGEDAKGKSDTRGNGPDPSKGGGNFRIERLLALRDAHLVAPSKDLRGRERLDVDFEQEPKPLAAATPASSLAGPHAADPTTASSAPTHQPGQEAAEKKTEPNMVVAANRVKARVLIDPSARPADGQPAGKPSAAGVASNPAAPDAQYQIREVRLFGAVTLHQDPEPGKTKGQDASGEALILQSEGPGKAIFNLYHRDPTVARTADPAGKPRARARVTTEDMDIEGEVIGVNQKTDQAWAYGPGKLVQLTDRGMLSDRVGGEENQEPNVKERNEADAKGATRPDGTARPRPRTRAGKVLTTKVPLTITWEEKMIFHGRSTDPEGRPAAKAEFTRNVLAKMEDAGLRCTRTMTTYTDQPIPLADIGKMKQEKAAAGERQGLPEVAEVAEAGPASTRPRPDLTLIDCVGDAMAVSRKVDPDRPVLLSMQTVTGDRLIYDRRTGDFQVPGPGMVYLYDRDSNDGNPQGLQPASPVANRRTIRPTSATYDDRRPGARTGEARSTPRPATVTARDDARKAKAPNGRSAVLPRLVLTQIRFAKEMRGRFGTGKETDRTETRWAEFFTNVEAARGPVVDATKTFDFDKLPADAYFLTSQTLRVVTEPPPPGTTETSPSRNFLKAWDDAYATAKATTIQADVITYDSLNDLIYARSLEGRPVEVVQQPAAGQPGSPTRAEAVRVNPKTGAAEIIGPQSIQWLDSRTGTRPTKVNPPDPNAKAPKPRKPFYRTPRNNIERRGYTGQ